MPIANIEDRTDHLGQVFETKKAMCEFYNISFNTYIDRIKNGKSKEEALTKLSSISSEKTDHLGHVFNSKKDMCQYWKVDVGTYNTRINSNWLKEEALTGVRNISDKKIEKRTDHTGKVFDTFDDMVNFWKVSNGTYYARIKNGWTKEEALTGNKIVSNIEENDRTDHTGQIFKSISEMCRHWDTEYLIYYNRYVTNGWSKEEALTGVRNISDEELETRTDPYGKVFKSIRKMCEAHNVSWNTYRQRIRTFSKEESLGIIPPLYYRVKHNSIITPDLKLIKFAYQTDDEIYFKCKYNEKVQILSRSEILVIFRNYIKRNSH